MSAITSEDNKDDDDQILNDSQQPLIKAMSSDDDAVTTNTNESTKDDDNASNNYNDETDDDIDPEDIPQIVIDKRTSNVINRRHSADHNERANNFEIKITGIDEEDEKKEKYNQLISSDNETDDELKNLANPGQITKTQSLDTGIEQIKQMDTLTDEMNVLSTKQTSIVTIETHESGHKTIVEQAVVPPRQVIDRYPFFSTPLTIESTNNAFRDFMARLQEMGFGEQAEAALVHTNAESVEAAVAYIDDMDDDSLWHRFVPPNNNPSLIDNTDINDKDALKELTFDDNMLCGGCGMAYSEHLIDHRGEQIQAKNDGFYGDLGGRVSMSIATLQQRQNQRLEIEKVRLNVANLNALSEEIESLEQASIIGQTSIDFRRRSISHPSIDDLSIKLKKSIEDIIKSDIDKKKTIDGPTETCMVCFDDKSINDFYKAPCGHNYCKECLQTHYKIKTKDGDVIKVSCIDPKCDREIPEEEVRQFLTDPELLNKYEKFRRDKLLMLNPNVRFCPKPDCEGHMNGSRWNPKLTCPVCSEIVCFNCSQHWHGYFVGCNQNVDIGYAKWALNKDVQKCPRCRIRIEKEEGCNHMTCQSCQYEFCWICKGKYSSSHFDPWNIFGCPGAQFTPRYCRCPSCFPMWLNRILIMICFLAVIVPLVIVAGTLWLVVLILVFCIRCDAKCDIDPCDCFD